MCPSPFLNLCQVLSRLSLTCRRFYILLFLLVLIFTQSGQSATFRNNPKVLYRPSICAALLNEFTVKDKEKIEVEKLLIDLTGRIYRQYEAAHPEIRQSSPQTINNNITAKHDALKGRLQYSSRLNQENLDQALYVVSDLSERGVEPDRIIWVTATEGKLAIQEKLELRRHILTSLQTEVRSKVRESLHEWRGTNQLKAALMGASFSFPAWLPDFEVLSGHSVLYALYIAYMFYNTSLMNLTAELGLTPIEWSRDDSPYEIHFIEHINQMEEALNDFTHEDLVVFSDKTILSTHQFTAMKSCANGTQFTNSESVVTSCIMETLNSADIAINEEVRRVLQEEYKKAKSNPRWSRPLTRMREVLFSHPQTGVPILVTGLEFNANFVYPPKRPRYLDQLKKESLSW